MKIVIAGGGLTGLIYGIRLTEEGHEVTIFEKRPVKDKENLNSLIYLREETLTILVPHVGEEVFNHENPKAVKEYNNPLLPIPEFHTCINIKDLLQAELNAAERANIRIHRECELIRFSRNENTKVTTATFRNNNQDKIFEIECDQLLLACGNHDIKHILKNNGFKPPLQLNATHLIGTRIPIQHDAEDYIKEINQKAAIGFRPNYNDDQSYLSILGAYLYALFSDTPQDSIGSFSVYLSSLNMFTMGSTYPLNRQAELLSDETKQVAFLQDQLAKLIAKFSHYNNLDVDWLKEMIPQITEENVLPITAFSMLLLPNEMLYKMGVIPIGDAFATSPFIFGSEFNEHVVRGYPIISDYLRNLENTVDITNSDKLIREFIDALWEKFILYTDRLNFKGLGMHMSIPDLVGNTVSPDGTPINLFWGRPLLRENLEKLNQEQTENYTFIPPYQQGGLLPKNIKENYTPIGLFGSPHKQTKRPEHLPHTTEARHNIMHYHRQLL